MIKIISLIFLINAVNCLSVECTNIPNIKDIHSSESAFCFFANIKESRQWVLDKESRNSLSQNQLHVIDSCINKISATRPNKLPIDSVQMYLYIDTIGLHSIVPCSLWLKIGSFACYLKNHSEFSFDECEFLPIIHKSE